MKIQVNSSSPRELVIKYVNIISTCLPQVYDGKLTDTEKEVVSVFITLPVKYSLSRFSKVARDYAFTQLENSLKNRANINGVLYKLIDKGYFYRDEDSIIYVSKPLLKGALILLAKVYPDKRFATDYELSKLGLPNNLYEKSLNKNDATILLTFKDGADVPDNTADQ